MTPRPRNPRSVVYATTIGFSAFALLRGQLPEARQGRALGLGGAHGALTVLPVKSARCPTAGGCVRR